MVTLLILEVIPHTRVAGSETGINHYLGYTQLAARAKSTCARPAALQRKPSQRQYARAHSWEVGVTATLA